jgi:DNA topoisomerase-2
MGATAKELLANKEFVELMLVAGLKIGQKVNSIDELRFGKLVILSDFDSDGHHCAGLICTMFKKFWPELFSLGAVYRFNTPLVKVEVDKKELYFYSLDDFNAWSTSNKSKKFNARYLKGLGSSTAKDFKKYFDSMDKHLVQITINDISDLDVVDLVFGKEAGAADRRKVWLDLN